ncbi:MAG: T9SS type A sorting domain-containing protein [bacterium]|nr:T9SS type A sorting domain-containing protein [bacterium]
MKNLQPLKYLAFLFFSLFNFYGLYAQGPGGVNHDNELWLKANTGITLTGGGVSLWEDQFNAFDVSQGVATARPTFNTNDANYNPAVVFDGVNDFLRHQLATSYTDEFTIFLVAKVPTNQSGAKSLFNNWHSVAVGDNSGTSFQLDVGAGGGANFRYNSWGDVVSSPNTGNYQIITLSSNANNPPQIDNNHNGLFTNSGVLLSNDYSQTFRDYELGTNRVAVEFLSSFTVEVILYRDVLTLAEIDKVESYLAVKYGITLDNIGGGTQGDYLASNATTIWDADINSAYHNDVIGIGRDDNESLDQRQSHTLDDTTRIYIDNLATSNILNNGSIGNDISYTLIGHDNGMLCTTTASLGEIPTGLTNCNLYSRLEREWKVTKTNFAQGFNLDITLNNCANPGMVNTNELRLLVDDDGDFSNGGTQCYYNGDGTGVVISYANPIITVTGISTVHVPDNSIRYITIASIQNSSPLPIGLTDYYVDCENGSPALHWSTASEVNNDYFSIEKSRDGIQYSVVATIDGNGSTNQTSNYQWTDETPFFGATYYQLTQTDFDGTKTMLGLRSADCRASENIQIYPNPIESNVHVYVNTACTISIIDHVGKLVYENKLEVGDNGIRLETIATGVYSARFIFDSGHVENRQIVKF